LVVVRGGGSFRLAPALLNGLSYRIKIWTLYSIHAFDGQTDKRTDSFLLTRLPCIQCSAVKRRRWGPRPNRDRHLTRFSQDRDVPKLRLETESSRPRLHACIDVLSEDMLMEKPYHLIVYEAPQATRLSGGASWAPPVGSGTEPRPKMISVLFKHQIMLLVEIFVVNILRSCQKTFINGKTHAFGRLGEGGSHPRPSPLWIRHWLPSPIVVCKQMTKYADSSTLAWTWNVLGSEQDLKHQNAQVFHLQ